MPILWEEKVRCGYEDYFAPEITANSSQEVLKPSHLIQFPVRCACAAPGCQI